jgi:pyruvate dehydrogenase E1 component alpha subunit
MTPISRASSVDVIYKWAAGYNMRTVQIDGNDVEVVHAAVSDAAQRARAGEGPTFIEGITYRLAGHMAGDLETYRSSEEIEAARAHEPLVVLRNKLLDRGAAEEMLEQIRTEVEKVVADAVEAAQNSPWPDPAEAYTDVYAIN